MKRVACPKKRRKKLRNILIQNPEKALDTLAREELGINPDDLGIRMGGGNFRLLFLLLLAPPFH